MTNSNNRQSEYPVDPLFLDRWSPRAFDGSPMPKEHLLTILDAAHWAPSASNHQPWRFVYAHKDSEDWPLFVELLMEGNQKWAKNASVLLFVISRDHTISHEGEKKPSATHSFDAGAAWFSLAMQAHLLGYHAHGMGGIFKDRIVEKLACLPASPGVFRESHLPDGDAGPSGSSASAPDRPVRCAM